MKRIGIVLGGGILWSLHSSDGGSSVALNVAHGSVSTHFRLLGPNDKIVIDGFDDPKVQGVAVTSPVRKRGDEG